MHIPDLAAHFASYREDLQAKALPGLAEFAKNLPTASPELYSSTFDYVAMAFSRARDAAEKRQLINYKTWLERHQEATLLTLEEMVRDYLGGYDGIQPEKLMDMASEKGMLWLRYCAKVLELDLKIQGERRTIRLIPRHDTKFYKGPEGMAYFDVDEILLLREREDEKPGLSIVDFKAENWDSKLTYYLNSETPCTYKKISDLNGPGFVDDWALPLFRH